MSIVKIKDKTFRTSITEAEIKERVKAVAQQISKDMEGKTQTQTFLTTTKLVTILLFLPQNTKAK